MRGLDTGHSSYLMAFWHVREPSSLIVVTYLRLASSRARSTVLRSGTNRPLNAVSELLQIEIEHIPHITAGHGWEVRNCGDALNNVFQEHFLNNRS